MAGVGCARTLLKKGYKNFKLITEDIGGRLRMSEDGHVAYGAYFIGDDYHHTKKFFKKVREINIFKVRFHDRSGSYKTASSFFHPIQVLKFLYLINKFRRHYESLKKRCENVSQLVALKEDEFLSGLYKARAIDFVKSEGIYGISKKFMSETMYGLIFLGLEEYSAFEFFRWMQYFNRPLYEFHFLKERFLSGMDQKIILGKVVRISKKKEAYEVKLKQGFLSCKNVVVATPPHISKKLVGIKKIKKPAKAYMFHIRGVIRPPWADDYELFSQHSELIDIAHQHDGSYLLYCLSPQPNLRKYFSEYDLVQKLHWDPAFNAAGHVLWDCEIKPNLFLIGDHNIIGMEDAFITGIYAANQIIKKMQ